MQSKPGTKSVSLLVRSPELAADVVDCVVTLPTFRRPQHLLETLGSLAAQNTARRFAVIVIENEAEERAGAEAAAPLFARKEMEGLVIVAHERGNCAAYNAGWRTALETFPNLRHLLVIDDDEIAAPGWLEAMCATAEKLEADIVGGPQVPIFADGTADRFRRHPVFLPPYERTGRVPALFSSGNLLVSRHVLEAMEQPFLDLRFNFMGGGDSDFLSRAAQKGYRLAWCAEAPVHETVPARRLEADWIRARSLRNGVISTLVEKKKRAGERLGASRVLGKSLALLALSPLRCLRSLFATGSVSSAMYPVYVGLGRVLAEFGYANEQYREPDKN
ncbi:glycosyltransferase family 2 protein [Chelativorans sp. M5D2P16]|uniref:glycosyltransferase family 2 protein n=1 Tax=Chelativorans sp. M5D2P16 TaxID=3095678 RepID=UPI002ACA36BE|nr:glycosyltransferase [Chelativorans sp. M5D2P16]MDZ5698893.1 glycosyltransferase [Chelativorans sp. M5D2P16]